MHTTGSRRRRWLVETKEKILEAADRLIRGRGLARVRTKEIAREAGVAEGTLYVHFPHKEDLFFAVVEKNRPEFAATVRPELAGTRELDVALGEVALAAMSYYEKLISMAAPLFADVDLLERQREAIARRPGGPYRIYERVAAYVEAEQRLGRVKEGLDALSVAALVLGPCFQYAFTRQFLGEDPLPVTEEQFVDDLAKTLAASLAPCR
jgi:AcrR family transcriptional regulator